MRSRPFALVLGIAQDGGHPQPGCHRPCCVGESVIPHLTTCVAVVDGGRGWLLDAGPDFPRHLAHMNAQGVELAGILLTHAHVGHYTGLMFLGAEAMDAELVPVWTAPRMGDFLSSNGPWNQLVESGNIELRPAEETIQLSSQVRATALPVPHRGEYSETIGWRIAGPRRSILYVPDTDGWDGWDRPIEEHLATADVALLDATFFSGDELPNRDQTAIAHPTVADSMNRFAAIGDAERAKIRFTHLNHTNPLLRPESDEYIKVIRSGMGVAAEGDIFEL